MLVALLGFISGCAGKSGRLRAGPGQVDFLDYFLQADDRDQSWTIGGTDVRPDKDPDGTATRTVVLNKGSDPKNYEVYKITDTQIQIRYEVVRSVSAEPKDNWIRRYEELNVKLPGAGAVWIPRLVTPGGEGYLSRFCQDRFVFDPESKSYVIDHKGSAGDLRSYLSTVWARDDWDGHDRTGFKLGRVLRLISQWQREGMMFEMYDYAQGKGLVAWRWLERVSSLTAVKGDPMGRIFQCENGHVLVESKGDGEHAPVIYMYDLKTQKRSRRLEVIRFTSYWRQPWGPQWYVVYRDSTKEAAIEKKRERIAHDYSLPEWTARPGATIKELPYLNTHPAQ